MCKSSGDSSELSISVGIAVADEAKGYDSNIIELADQQLYLSKQRGRNTYSVVLA
ncbi:diguanylate cyclase domain-containing protein [Shewanella sp. SM101]|uniref:diguanylate cyclase domain-containing protein n=1 Tax=Shewanella sp. SM101 TaxID=2912789 RepID=UPI0039876B41